MNYVPLIVKEKSISNVMSVRFTNNFNLLLREYGLNLKVKIRIVEP